jgi:hypothetical protein
LPKHHNRYQEESINPNKGDYAPVGQMEKKSTNRGDLAQAIGDDEVRSIPKSLNIRKEKESFLSG